MEDNKNRYGSSDDIYISSKKRKPNPDYDKSRKEVKEAIGLERNKDRKPGGIMDTAKIEISVARDRNRIDSDDEKPDVAPPKRPKKLFLKVVAVVLAFFVVFGFASVKSIVNGFIQADEIEHIEDVDSLVSEEHVRNILLIGTDREKGGSARSDSIMIASINEKTGRVTVCSVLRDTHLYVPGECEAKVNSAYAWGGANLLVQTIEHNFGIKIDDYATVNFEMFMALVDGLGGVEVSVTEAEADYINNVHRYGANETKPEHVDFGESVHLDGNQALWYARIRKLDSDFNRTERQRKIISAIMVEAFTQLNPIQIFGLMSTAKDVAQYIETTLTEDDFRALVSSMAVCVVKNGTDTDNLLVTQKIPFDGTWDYANRWDGSSIAIDLEKNREMLYDTLYGEPVEETTEEETEE